MRKTHIAVLVAGVGLIGFLAGYALIERNRTPSSSRSADPKKSAANQDRDGNRETRHRKPLDGGQQESCVVKGIVLRPFDRAPVCSASVFLCSAEKVWTAQADDHGRFIFQDVLSARYAILAQADPLAWRSAAQELILDPGQGSDVELILPIAATIRGVILGAPKSLNSRAVLVSTQGNREERHEVEVRENTFVAHLSMADSQSEMTLDLANEKDPYATAWIPKDAETEVLFQYPHGGTIIGTVLDESGSTVVGAAIEAQGPTRGDERLALSGEGGMFQLSGLRDGNYWVVARHQAYTPGVSPQVQLRDEKTEHVVITMSRGVRFTGIVKSTSSEPIAGAFIGVDGTIQQVRSGKDGRFTLGPVKLPKPTDGAKFECSLLASAAGYGSVRLVGASIEMDNVIVLPRGASVRFDVRIEGGGSPGRITVRRRDQEGNLWPSPFSTPLVRISLPLAKPVWADLAPGSYEFEVGAPRYATVKTEGVLLKEGEERVIEITLRPGKSDLPLSLGTPEEILLNLDLLSEAFKVMTAEDAQENATQLKQLLDRDGRDMKPDTRAAIEALLDILSERAKLKTGEKTADNP